MHIDVVPNRTSRPTFLLRESYRDGTRVRKRTLANLSALTDAQIDAIRAVLRGESRQPAGELFDVIRSLPHGHVHAVSVAMHQLGFASLLSSRAQPERELVCALVAARILAPHTKLATTRWWHTTTLAQQFGVARADEDDLYHAMDWLLERQEGIEKKLAARHLGEGAVALYDLSSSYVEGSHCPLARLGYSRDGRRGTLQVNYGLLTDRRGCPVSVSVYEGNVSDSLTLLPQVLRLKRDFGIEQVVLVGDRGMISHAAVEQLRTHTGLAWITALKSAQIRALVEGGALQLGLFDTRNLFELTHPDYPGERLVACRNEELGRLRGHKRQALLEATEQELERVRAMVERGALQGAAHDRGARGQSTAQVQDGQAHRAPHRRAALSLPGAGRLGRSGGGARWAVRDPQPAGAHGDGQRRTGAHLQGARPGRARVSHDQDGRPEDPSDSPPHRTPRAGPHLSVRARLLRGMAHA